VCGEERGGVGKRETYEKVIFPVAGARVGVVGTEQLTAAGPYTVHSNQRIEEENLLEMREETCLLVCKSTHNNNNGLKKTKTKNNPL